MIKLQEESIPLPRVLGMAEGETRWLHGDTYTIKLNEKDTRGAFSLIDASVPPGGGPPLHVHKDADEVFYIIFGELDVTIDDKIHQVSSGDLIYIPKNVPHAFRNNGLHTVRQLLLFTPAGFENFFIEAGTPALPSVNPPHFDAGHNQRVIEVAHQYHAYQLPQPDLTRSIPRVNASDK